METNRVIVGDCLEMLKTLPDESVNCCITSPPYYGLRDYGTGTWVGGDPNCNHYRSTKYSENTITGHKAMMDVGEAVGDAIYKSVCPKCGAVRVDKQIGLEETPEMYIAKLVDVFHEVKRVLKNDGTLWLNIGDSYCGTGDKGYKHKDLIGIPWMLAFALRADGWYLRQDIIWHKPNPMPESVKDRCTKSHEYIFLLSKNPQYYFDYQAIQEESKWGGVDRRTDKGRIEYDGKRSSDDAKAQKAQNAFVSITEKRNKRDVWSIATKPCKEAHFATYPEDLIEPCILAGCPVGGVVLDPFFGSGTTGRVALSKNRQYLGIELNPEYVKISKKRTSDVQVSFAGIVDGIT